MKIFAGLSTISLTLISSILLAKVSAFEQQAHQQGVKGCQKYVANDYDNWSALTEIKKVKSWDKGYDEYVSHHDAKGQFIRFAAELSRDSHYNRLGFSNRPVLTGVIQYDSTFRYTINLKGGETRMMILQSGKKCYDTGMKVDFQSANVESFSVDILGV